MSIRDELETAVTEAIKRLTFAARGDCGIDVRAAKALLRAGIDAGLFDVAQTGPAELSPAADKRNASKHQAVGAETAVSESAAGEQPRYNGMPEKAWLLLAELHSDAGYLFGRVAADGSVAAMMTNAVRAKIDAVNAIFQPVPPAPTEWPGPDWSQAPEGSIGWVAQDTSWPSLSPALWVFGPGKLAAEGWWNTDAGYRASVKAPLFNYPGHWRDSLRKRPSGGGQ